MQMTGFCQQRTDDTTSFKLWRETVWKRSGIAVKLNLNPTHPVNLVLSDPRTFSISLPTFVKCVRSMKVVPV